MMRKNKALILSNDPKLFSEITGALTREDIKTDYGESLEAGLVQIEETAYAVAFLDESVCAPNPTKAVSSLAQMSPDTRIIYLHSPEYAEAIALAVAAGALAHLSKPVDPFDVVQTFRRVMTLTPKPVTSMSHEKLQASAKSGQIFGLLGASDNVGKTTLTVNLAAALATREVAKVCIVDLDLQFGDVCGYLGIKSRSTFASLSEEWSGKSLDRHITAWKNGVDILAAPSRPELAETVTPEMVQVVLQQLRNEYAYVIVDTATGFNEVNLAAIDAADTILLVGVLDTIAAVKNIKTCLDTLQKLGCQTADIKLVLNRDGAKPALDRRDVEKALGRGFDAALPDKLQTMAEAIAAKDTVFGSGQSNGLSAEILKLAECLRPRLEEPEMSGLSFTGRLKKIFAKTPAKKLTG